jgi:hypothetical protein
MARALSSTRDGLMSFVTQLAFHNAWLYILRTEWEVHEEKYQSLERYHTNWPHNESSLVCFGANNRLTRGTSALMFNKTLDIINPLKAEAVLYRCPTNPDRPDEVFVKLGQVSIEDIRILMKKARNDFSIRSNLIDSLFVGQRIREAYHYQFTCILYLEPLFELASNELSIIAPRICEFLDCNRNPVPEWFRDILVLPGALYPNPEYDLIAIRNTPFPRLDIAYRFSQSVVDLADNMLAMRGLKYLRNEISSTELLKDKPDKYLNRILASQGTRGIGTQASNVKILSSAYNMHLVQQKSAFELQQKVRDTLSHSLICQERFASSRAARNSELPWGACLIDEPELAVGILEQLEHQLNHSANSLKDAVEELKALEEMCSAHVRDFFNAEVAISNLRLQKTLYFLTFASTAIALVALFKA